MSATRPATAQLFARKLTPVPNKIRKLRLFLRSQPLPRAPSHLVAARRCIQLDQLAQVPVMFGTPAAPASNPFSFSTPAAPTSSLFGAPAPATSLFGTPTAPTATTGGLFGSTAPAPAAPKFSFGAPALGATPPAPMFGGGLFGGAGSGATTTSPAMGLNLGGVKPSLFGQAYVLLSLWTC